MSSPQLIELSRADFVTIDTIGPPGQRTFYLQAAQEDTLVTLIIEKEHAAALSIAISGVLEKLEATEQDEPDPPKLGLIQPVEPLFRVERLGLGYDQTRDMLIITAEELVAEEEKERQGTKVHIWANRDQMATLAHNAAVAVASGRPVCPLCKEVMEPGEQHVCVRGNGRKRLYDV